MYDSDAYKKYSKHRKWFNKLWLSEKLKYLCGPSGMPVERTGHYIVRPIMNLSGMSINASRKLLEIGDTSTPPGYFWCEWFDGVQRSVTFRFEDSWKPVSSWVADRDCDMLFKFKSWKRETLSETNKLPEFFNEINDVKTINVEFIDEKIIEVHLRDTKDPDYDILIPVWKGEEQSIDIYKKMGYSYINDYDDGDGHLPTPRLGFLVK